MIRLKEVWRFAIIGLMAHQSLLFHDIAQAREALSLDGKTGLYQRVLTRPGARLVDANGNTATDGQPLPPLTALYVYQRSSDWVEVGASAKDARTSRLPTTQVIDWRQTLTVAFNRTEDREPALFFRRRDRLIDLLESEQASAVTRRLRDTIRTNRIPDDFPVIASEPETYVDPNSQFYLLPILGYEEVFLESGHSTTMLNVAAVTLQSNGPESSLKAAARQDVAGDVSDYRVGIVFVIDTTISMGPYIERTHAAVQRIYDRLKDSPMRTALGFGAVAYRSNVEATPGLEYVTRIVAPLKDAASDEFLTAIAQVEPARVSSKRFDEDAFAGVHEAIEGIDWSGYAGRFVVLITDAGALDANDPLARTRLGPERLRLLAQEKDQESGGGKIAVATLHLLTPEGRHNHAGAAAQYRALSRWGESEQLYFPVEGGSVAAYGTQVDALVDALLVHLESVHSGRAPADTPAEPATEIGRKTARIGRALQLAYLGRRQGVRAPSLIDAWIADRDPGDPERRPLEVRVLITKNQLSDLQETLQAIFQAGEQTFMTPKDFFTQLRGAAAVLARHPERVNQIEVKRLADVGLVGTWLEDLPYTSQIMNLTESRWLARSYAEQQEVLDAIEEKIRLYRQIHDETERWVSLLPNAPKGEAVTTIPLDALP